MSDNMEKDPQSILCDMCIGEDRKPARKTCMKCEISMCVQHLQAHLTTPVLLQTHPLTEPMAIDASTKCPQHGKLVEYYCLDDMTCVCVSCAIEDQHRLHNMKTFTTAHKELMEKLQTEQLSLQQRTDDESVSLEKWEKNESEKVRRCSVRLIEAVTNLRDVSLSSVQSSVSARMASLKTSRSSMQAAQREKDTFRFLQMYSQVHQNVEKAKAVDLRKGLEPGNNRDKIVQEIRQHGDKLVKEVAHYMESLLILVDPENHQDLTSSGSDLIFEPQILGPSMSLSEDKKKVFYHSREGECSGTLLITGTQSAPNFQRWTVSLTKKSDWMVGLCDKQSVNNWMNGPVYGLCCEDNHLSFVTTKYDDPSLSSDSGEVMDFTRSENPIQVIFEELKRQGEDIDEEIPRPEKVEVFWDIVASTLSFFRRTGQYQREEIITITMRLNNTGLVPFIQLGKKDVQLRLRQTWTCSCGKVYNKDINGYRDSRSRYSHLANCPCGRVLGGPFFSEVVCEIL